MIRRSSVLVFICLGLALISNANARPHRRNTGDLMTTVPKLLASVEGKVTTLLNGDLDDAVEAKLQAVQTLVAQLKGELNKVLTSTTGVLAKLSLISQVLTAVDAALNKVTSLLKNTLDVDVPEVLEILTDVVQALTTLIQKVLVLVANVVLKLASSLDTVGKVLQTLNGLKLQAVGEDLTNVVQAITKAVNLQKTLEKVGQTVNNLVFSLNLDQILGEILGKVTSIEVGLVKVVTSLTSQGVVAIVGVVTQLTGLLTIVTTLLNSVLGLVGTLLNGVLGGLSLGGSASASFSIINKRAIY